MTEFKVSAKQHSDGRARLILWGGAVLLVGIALFASCGAWLTSEGVDTILALVAAVIVMGSVGSAYVLAARSGIERTKLSTVFLLNDEGLIRKRHGWPDVRIGLNEIRALSESAGWLVVESLEPCRRIAIPDDVEEFENLRSELAKHGPIVKSPRRSLFPLASLAVSLICWALVLLSNKPAVVQTAGLAALVLLAWESVCLARLVARSTTKYASWIVLAFGWAGALWVVYTRLSRL